MVLHKVIGRLITLVAIGLSLTAIPALAQQKLYRWVDDEGVVHYGDTVPAQFADRDRTLLNEQGVTVGFEQGEITPEERAEMERRQALAEKERLDRENAARRDRVLRDTYITVADIEDLRDRRLELIESQIRVTEFYLNNLRRRLDTLEKDTQRFAPYNESEDAQPVPEYLTLDVSRTEASITLYEQTLTRTRQAQQELKDAFGDDIIRFRELLGDG